MQEQQGLGEAEGRAHWQQQQLHGHGAVRGSQHLQKQKQQGQGGGGDAKTVQHSTVIVGGDPKPRPQIKEATHTSSWTSTSSCQCRIRTAPQLESFSHLFVQCPVAQITVSCRDKKTGRQQKTQLLFDGCEVSSSG
jgi:hypothetical protein